MRDILNKLIMLLGLVSFLVIAAAVVFAGNVKQVFDDIESGTKEAVSSIWTGLEIIFFVALVLGIIYALIRFKQMRESHIIRDGKNGEQVRAVVHQGQLVQIMDLSADPTKQLDYFKQLMQMAGTAALNMKRMDGVVGSQTVEADEAKQIEQAKPVEEYLHISDIYKPHADEILSARKLVVGISGSGKSNTTATMCEELGRLNVPMVLADTENEYESLNDRRYLSHGVLVDSRMVTAENAADFGRHVLEQSMQVILNLHSYEMPEAALVMVNLIAGMKQWQEERANELRIPCEFLLEEATTWLPQNVKESQLYGSEVMSRLQDAFFNDMVRKGRKRGLGLTVICQKIAEIDKRALQCEVKLLHRQTELIDLEKYTKMGITNEETLALQNGEGYYFSSKKSKLKIQVRRRYSDHGANTPGLENLRKYQQNSGRNPVKQAGSYEIFKQPVEPFHNISAFRQPTLMVAKSTYEGIPEKLVKDIERLYEEKGCKNRVAIRDELDLNGDQYWMVRVVCDEYDRKMQVAEEA